MFFPELLRRLAVCWVRLNRADRADHMTSPLGAIDTFRTATRIDCVLFGGVDIDRAIGALIDADAAPDAIRDNAVSHLRIPFGTKVAVIISTRRKYATTKKT
jgi:hypothetical protein